MQMDPIRSTGDQSRPRKRVRKGTRSCISCRRRKTKCIFASDASETCTCCAKGGFRCIPQGFWETSFTSGSKRSRLRARLLELETLIDQLVPDDHREAGGSLALEEREDAIVQAIDDLDDAVRLDRRPDGRPTECTGDSGVAVDGEAPLKMEAAPLMRLLENPLLGRNERAGNDAGRPSRPQRSSATREGHRSSARHQGVFQDLLKHLPSNEEMFATLDSQGDWWALWRSGFGFSFGRPDCTTLRLFANYALSSNDPSLLGTLLVSLGVSTGDLSRYISPVERHIVHDDEIAATENGLSCLMILGLCYLTSLQPRRAWMVYRRANTLLQLNGLHLTHRRSVSADHIFWQLFQADRWVSLNIGLPYLLHDQFCDLEIKVSPSEEPGKYLFRHLAILTGRVVDHLQTKSSSIVKAMPNQSNNLSSVISLEEEMDSVFARLPQHYLDFACIKAAPNSPEKFQRLYMKIFCWQLRTYLYLPLFLRLVKNERLSFSRNRCLEDSRHLLEAYLIMFDADQSATSNGTTLHFTIFVAAVVVVLGALGYGGGGGEAWPSQLELMQDSRGEDWQLIERTLAVMAEGKTGISAPLCKQCYAALSSLVTAVQGSSSEGTRTVILPYFGAISIKWNRAGMSRPQASTVDPDRPVTAASSQGRGTALSIAQITNPAEESVPPPAEDLQPPTLEDVSLSYHGPFGGVPNIPDADLRDDWTLDALTGDAYNFDLSLPNVFLPSAFPGGAGDAWMGNLPFDLDMNWMSEFENGNGEESGIPVGATL